MGPTAGVVKADAYGLGARAVAPALHAAGCRHFFTAHPSEAFAIRPLLPDSMVAVLNGLWPGLEAEFAASGLTPVLGTTDEIDRWAAQARTAGRRLPAIVHVDTGMNRLGLDARGLDALAADPGRLGGLDPALRDDAPGQRRVPRTTRRTSASGSFSPRPAPACPPRPAPWPTRPACSLAPASRPTWRGPAPPSTASTPRRAGPTPSAPLSGCAPACCRCGEVPEGDSVGYNAQWTAARPSRIATVSVGYADGFPRTLSNRAVAYFDDRPVPLVGRVSMDLSTFDVTDVPGLQPGAWLDLFGPGGVDEVARLAGTNGYEILTSLGRRYGRLYS